MMKRKNFPEADMTAFLTRILKNMPTLVLLLFAALSFAVVLDARDPIGFLGWMFCFTTILTVGCQSPTAVDTGY